MDRNLLPTPEDQEEFFETSETVPSASASSESESGGEDNHRRRSISRPSMAKVTVETQMSRYEVWTNSSGSVFERRQRLLTQMGLLVSHKGPDSSLDTASSADASSMRSIPKPAKSGASGTSNHHEASLCINKEETLTYEDNEGVKPRSFNPMDVEVTSSRMLASSGCSSPSSTHGHDHLEGGNDALLRSAWCGNTLNPVKADSHDLNISHQSNLECRNVLIRGDSVSVDQDGSLPESQNGDLVYRIKDLDSGKEFIVDRIGNDGSWNKLKELDTGRELTIEEFESNLGLSPIVQEVMKRERAVMGSNGGPVVEKKSKAWINIFKGMARGSVRSASAEKNQRKTDSVSHASRESSSRRTTKRIKVHAHKKSTKEISDLYLRQEIQAHEGAIWTMKFSLDGSFLATAGEDKVVRVWEVVQLNGSLKCTTYGLGESCSSLERHCPDDFLHRQNSRSATEVSRQTVTAVLPFFLSETSKCDFYGHKEDILDVAWSHSQSLLSSSMDKTVRLWNILSGECLRIFTHNDYVTCIHFNPIDDGYFISGSLDGKVRIWSIQERQVVDWVDLNEMVTAACYTPNGEGAIVGSYKGTCRVYKMQDKKLQFHEMFQAQRKKNKRSEGKKITGIQFIPGENSKILVSSADSRIRVYEGTQLKSKYKGLRNKTRQISASFSSNGMYIISASEDSRVCIWRYHDMSTGYPVHQRKALSGSYEDFSAPEVSIAIPWPGTGLKSAQAKLMGDSSLTMKDTSNTAEVISSSTVNQTASGKSSDMASGYDAHLHTANGIVVRDDIKEYDNSEVHQHGRLLNTKERNSPALSASSMLDRYLEDCSLLSKSTSNNQSSSYGFFSDGRGSATWPEENLPAVQQASIPADFGSAAGAEFTGSNKISAVTAACGLIIVTAGLAGGIRIFQNQS